MCGETFFRDCPENAERTGGGGMRVTILGTGKMGCAMALGLLRSGRLEAGSLTLANRSGKIPQALQEFGNLRLLTDNGEACRDADYVVLAVLPQQFGEVIPAVSESAPEGACLISIAPGFTVEKLEQMTGRRFPIVRAMPNTPAVIGQGMIAVCENPSVPEDVFAGAVRLLSSLGRTEIIRESQMNAVIGVSGSSPAYFFMFLDALADAGVLGGLHRDQAVRLARQTMLGCALLAAEQDLPPSVLKDMVCSPAGTTIEAVSVLEDSGFRGAVIRAARAAMDKAERMGRKKD